MLKTISMAALLSLAASVAMAQSGGSYNPGGSGFFAAPTPNGGAIIGGQLNGTGGIMTHQPLGGGYTTNGVQIGTPGGNQFGTYVTTDPSGRVIGGGGTIGTTW